MDPLYNNAAPSPPTPQADQGEGVQTSLPTADVSSVRGAAMSAATSGPRVDTPPGVSETHRLEQIRIIIGSDTPGAAAYASFNGGRGVPFTSQELKDALILIDTLSRIAHQSGIGLSGIQFGDQRHSAGPHNYRHFGLGSGFSQPYSNDRVTSSVHQQAPMPRERDRAHETTPAAPPEQTRTMLERAVAPKENARIEHLKEKLERALDKSEAKTVDPLSPPRGERPVALIEKAPPSDPSAIKLAPVEAKPEVARPVDVSRTQETQPPAKDTPNLVTAAINATLNDARNDTARLVAQMLNNDMLTPPQVDRTTPNVKSPVLYSSPFEARERVQEKLSQIREALQAAIERTSPVASTSHQSTSSQVQIPATTPVGDFSRFEVPRQELKPTTTIATQGRSAADRNVVEPSSPGTKGEPPMRGVDGNGRIPGPSSPNTSTGPQPLRAAGASESSAVFAPLEKGTTLVDALSKSTQRILNIQLLQKLDRALETVVISGAAAIALGVMGGEALLKQLAALSREILARLRESGPHTKEQQAEHQSIEKMIQELEESCRDRGIEKTERPAGFVADITGVVVLATNGLPVEGVIIDAGTLGSTITDTFGEFRIANVPLETGFSLTCHDHRYSFFPNPIVGTVATMNHFKIQATKLG